MAQPHPGQAVQARKLVIQLGQLLTDITAGRPVTTVHQHLLDQFDADAHDYRIDAMEVGADEFAVTWHALQYGLALPAGAWEQVVLPTVVGFSSAQKLKMRLELATSYWLAARAAVDAVPDYPAAVAALAPPDEYDTDHTLPVVPPAPTRPSAPLRSSATDAATAATPPTAAPSPTTDRPARTGPDRRVLVAVAVAVLATVTVMLVLVINPTGDGQPVSLQDGMPSPVLSAGVMADESGQPVTLPTAPPSNSPEPAPMITNEPLPKPTWTPPAPPTTKPGVTSPPPPPPPVAPSAPTRLTAVAAVEHKIWLSWSAPANGGSGGVAFYRILRDGQFIGWTRDTSATVAELAPGTSYVFVVIAVNAAGLQSGPSNQITTMTASPSPLPAPSPTTTPSPSPSPSPSEAPSPTPAETTAEPSPSPQATTGEPSPEVSSPDPDPPTEPAEAA